MRELVELLIIFAWAAGVFIAKGFWSTLIALAFPPWGWYLSVEFVIKNHLL